MKAIRLISGAAIKKEPRGGAPEGVADISWAIHDYEGAALACGFGSCDGETASKTLSYDEIILILEGALAVEADGIRVQGAPGDVIEVSKGSTVKYHGKQSRLFFVTN